MEKKDYIALIVFVFFLLVFAFFSMKIGFHDSYEYTNTAKNFAGIKNINIFVGHSMIYPLIISMFLKIWPSLTMIKLVNVFWIFLIGFVLLKWLKNKKAFILFAFSPLTWYVSIQTTPVLPASFFFLLAFIFWYKKNTRFHLIYSGIFLGISCSLYTPMMLVSLIFLTIYFWDLPFKQGIKYVLAMGVGFLPRMIQEFYLFKMPFYSLIRYIGNNFIVALGSNPDTKTVNLLSNLWVLSALFIISPFLFKLYKLEFKKYKKPLIFLGITGLIFLLRVQQIKYFLVLSPVICIFLSRILSDKEIKWHKILSLIIAGIMVFSFFMINEENIVKKDIEDIKQDFDVDYIVAGPFEVFKFSTFSWENKPYFVWWQDFQASKENKTRIRGYDYSFNSKIPLKDKLMISASFNRFEEKVYENYILVTEKNFPELSDFILNKCYKKVCVYEAQDNKI